MDQQFSLSWNNFHGNLSKGFASLLGNGEFVDVTIAVEGHLLQAHKVILSICSPYFKKMFQLNPCQHPIVVLRDVTHKAMRDLLQFMYHGEVSVKRDDLTSFIGTAEVLQIKGLTNKETEDDGVEIDKSTQKQNSIHPSETIEADVESCTSDMFDSPTNETQENNDIDLLKQKELIDRLKRLSSLKRRSDEFIQKNYFSDPNSEKRIKVSENPYIKINQTHQTNLFDNVKSIYDETVDITKSLNTATQKVNTEKGTDDKTSNEPIECVVELKTECDDSDIIVTDPAVCTTPKSYESTRDGKKTMSVPMEYQSPQDNYTGLSALFMDLKNLVNGKFTNNLGSNGNEELPRPMEHRLVTIPQKEDGKKKYPQRSCRLCWRIGKRRDTRFMCNSCELPFCKSPCFEIHFNDMFKVSQLQGDYYAT